MAKQPGKGADIASGALGVAATGLQAVPVFGQIAGAVLGIGAGIAAMIGNRKRKKHEAHMREVAKKTMGPQGPGANAPAVSGVTGQSPVQQAGLARMTPTIIQPAAAAAGQIKRTGTPTSLNSAKQNYLFRVAMNNKEG